MSLRNDWAATSFTFGSVSFLDAWPQALIARGLLNRASSVAAVARTLGAASFSRAELSFVSTGSASAPWSSASCGDASGGLAAFRLRAQTASTRFIVSTSCAPPRLGQGRRRAGNQGEGTEGAHVSFECYRAFA